MTDDEDTILQHDLSFSYEKALHDVIKLLEDEEEWWKENQTLDYGTAWTVFYHIKKAIYQAMTNPPEGALE